MDAKITPVPPSEPEPVAAPKVCSEEPHKCDPEALYERALTLIQIQGLLYWQIYGPYLLAETVLLGGIASHLAGPKILCIGGSALGAALAIPWWAAHEYGSTLYRLRIMQARNLEPAAGQFLIEGQDVIDGKMIHGVKMPPIAMVLRPKHVNLSLIAAFAIAFMSLAICRLLKP